MMKIRKMIIPAVFVVCIMLFASGCGNTENSPAAKSSAVDKSVSESTGESETDIYRTVIGNGKTEFLFDVVDSDGNTASFEIHTDKEYVGEALEEDGLISGEEGPYGLYVKTVNGTTLDYDKDNMYWAFYVDGEYATSGADKTPVESGKIYSFKAEK